MERLPEELEYEAAGGAGGQDLTRSFEEEVKDLMALTFGTAVVLAILITSMIALYAVTGWGIFLVLNLFVAFLGILAFFYLRYRRNKLTLRL
jgi:hypothetical protein